MKTRTIEYYYKKVPKFKLERIYLWKRNGAFSVGSLLKRLEKLKKEYLNSKILYESGSGRCYVTRIIKKTEKEIVKEAKKLKARDDKTEAMLKKIKEKRELREKQRYERLKLKYGW